MCYHIWQLLLSLSLSLSIRTSSILLQPLFLILLPSWAAYFFHSIFFFSSYRFSFSSFLYLLVCNSISVFSSSPSFLFVTISFSLISSQFLVLSLSPFLFLSLSLSLSPPPSLSLSVQLWAPPYVSIAIGKWNPWWSRCHGDSLHSLTSAHLTSPLALSLSVCLSFSFSFFLVNVLSSLILVTPSTWSKRGWRIAGIVFPASYMNTACLQLLTLLFLFCSLSSFLDYPIRASFFFSAVPFLFIQHSPCSRPLSHDSSTSFGSSFLSTFRQLDAFLTTRSTHPEGTTVELYSASTTTIVSSSVRWKADKQRRCKRAAPFHFCLTSNLLQHRLMKETWSDRPWWRSEGRLEA